MHSSPALLLLLALGLCCPGIHGQHYELRVSFRNSITQLQVGQRLELLCQTGSKTGVFWIHQDKSGTPHFIVSTSSKHLNTFQGNQRTSRRFEASKDRRFYQLVVKSFTPQDEGHYFCVININEILYFSRGQPAFLPVTTTQPGTTTKNPDLTTLDPERRMQEELESFCHIFIWVPFTGICLLLLQLLAITILLYQRRTHHNSL
ncbi:T-cell surface glycoprotein CD8 alpha chain-like isoform X2 [Pithys albifrons albifrons]|uniref:T-cell surface glycoprotein CD8 alpha chain-like isoform X2 n=1 Tax=Pithys albifrons albifrons TaxID=3385563 RepID=UPI003A5CEC94